MRKMVKECTFCDVLIRLQKMEKMAKTENQNREKVNETNARVNVVEDEVKEASEENLDPEVRGAQKEFREGTGWTEFLDSGARQDKWEKKDYKDSLDFRVYKG